MKLGDVVWDEVDKVVKTVNGLYGKTVSLVWFDKLKKLHYACRHIDKVIPIIKWPGYTEPYIRISIPEEIMRKLRGLTEW